MAYRSGILDDKQGGGSLDAGFGGGASRLARADVDAATQCAPVRDRGADGGSGRCRHGNSSGGTTPVARGAADAAASASSAVFIAVIHDDRARGGRGGGQQRHLSADPGG